MAGFPRPHFLLLLVCACAAVNILFYMLTVGDITHRAERPDQTFIDIDADIRKAGPAGDSNMAREENVAPAAVGNVAVGGWRRLQHSRNSDTGDTGKTRVQHGNEFPINNVNACAVGENASDTTLDLVVIVISDVSNFVRRHAIRHTWGSVVRNIHVSLVFLVGHGEETVERQVRKESQLYEDIVQVDIAEAYGNLSLKSISMLQWIHTYCRNSRFYLKSDDDMYINIENALKALHSAPRGRFFMCYLFRGAEPIRNKNSKWYTSVDEYSGRYFPTYCSGTAYAFASSIVPELYEASRTSPILRMEDVYITGILGKVIKASYLHSDGFWYLKRKATGCEYKNAISGHEVTTQEMQVIFSQLYGGEYDCDSDVNYIKAGLTDMPYPFYRHNATVK